MKPNAKRAEEYPSYIEAETWAKERLGKNVLGETMELQLNVADKTALYASYI